MPNPTEPRVLLYTRRKSSRGADTEQIDQLRRAIENGSDTSDVRAFLRQSRIELSPRQGADMIGTVVPCLMFSLLVLRHTRCRSVRHRHRRKRL